MTNKIQVPKADWMKFWSFKFSLLGGSILANYYPNFMEKQMGRGFNKVMIVSRKGHTSCYLDDQERKEYGLFQIKKYVKRDNVSDFCKFLKEKTDNIISVAKNLKEKDKITTKEFQEFVNLVYHYTGFYTVPRQIVDFIESSLAEKVLEDLRKARLYAEPVYSLIEDALENLAKQISKKEEYEPDLILSLTLKELEHYFKTGKLPEKDILTERFEACALFFNKERYSLTTDYLEIDRLEKIHIKDSKEGQVSGTIAYKGKAKGIARIIFNPFKVAVFNKGDILITGMTRPDYLPLMEKSSAIVTDVGGMLCHAAIVSRELKKPCIIGTQFATKKFKDGDLVEVDAEKGVVRKIKPQ